MIVSQKPTVQLEPLEAFAHPQIPHEQVAKYGFTEIRFVVKGFHRDEIGRIWDADALLRITMQRHTKYSYSLDTKQIIQNQNGGWVLYHDIPPGIPEPLKFKPF